MHMPSGILTHAHRHHRYGREASLGVYEILTRLERSSVDRDDDIMAKLASTLLNLGRAEDAVPWTSSRGTRMYECVMHETQDMRRGLRSMCVIRRHMHIGKNAYIRIYTYVHTFAGCYLSLLVPQTDPTSAFARRRTHLAQVPLTCNRCVSHLQQLCRSPATNVSLTCNKCVSFIATKQWWDCCVSGFARQHERLPQHPPLACHPAHPVLAHL